MASMDWKQCSKCKVVKRTDDFYKGNASFGKMSWCKSCANNYKLEDDRKFPEKVKRRTVKRALQIPGRAYLLWKTAKNRSVPRQLEFTLTKERIERALMVGVCERTGIRFELEQTEGMLRNKYGPSIDRKNPFKGYTDDNVQIVVSMYNLGKSQFTDDDFIDFCRRVVAYVDK